MFENVAPQSPESIAPVDSAYSSPTSQDFGASTSPDIESRARMQEMNDSSVSFSTSPTHVDKLQIALNWNATFDPKSHGVIGPSAEARPDTASDTTGEIPVSSPQQSPASPAPSSPQVSSLNQEESTSPSMDPAPQFEAHSPPSVANFPPVSSEQVQTETANFQVSLPSSSSPPAVSWLSIGILDDHSKIYFESDQTSFREDVTVTSENMLESKKRPESPVSVPELKYSAIMTLGNFFNSIPDISEEEEGCDEPPTKRRCVSTSPYMSEADWMDLLGQYSSSSSFTCRCSQPSPMPVQDHVLPPQMAFPSNFQSMPFTNDSMYYPQRAQYFAGMDTLMTADNYSGYFTLPMKREQIRWAAPNYAASEYNWTESTAYVQSKTKAEQRKGKPQDSYISMIGHSILASPTFQASLPEIYDNIMEHYPFYRTTTLAWRNAVRHNLSANECFVKAERTETGRGWMWTIHPSCVEQFRKGDFRRREARNRVQHLQRRTPYSN